MSLGRFMITAGLTLASFASARMVPQLPEKELSPYSCKLTLQGPKEKISDREYRIPTGTCSVTLFSGTLVATAAHCFAGKTFESGEVICPGQAPRKVVGWQIPDNFPAKSSDELKCEDIAHDLAVVRVSPPFKKHARFPRSAKEVTALTTGPDTNCRIFGYGQDAKGKVGDHNGRKVEFGKWLLSTNVRTWSDPTSGKVVKREETPVYGPVNRCGALQIRGTFTPSGETAPISVIRNGDSGGGLICRDVEGEEVLVGITSGTTTTNDKTPVASSVSLAQGFDEFKGLIGKLLDKPALELGNPPPRRIAGPVKNH